MRKKDNPHFHNDPGHDPEVWKSEELLGPGKAVSDAVPTQFDQATGKERIEYMALLEGKDPYCGLMDPLNISAKGTKANPIEVVSPDEDRIVGCTGLLISCLLCCLFVLLGHPGQPHAPQFLLVTEDGHKYWQYGHNRCTDCGNTFKLKRIEIPYPSIH